MTEIIGEVRDNLRSSGNVHIKVLNAGKVFKELSVHNTGTIDLCRFVRDSLLGSHTTPRIPGFIIPCKKINGQLIPLTAYCPAIGYSSSEDVDNGIASAIIKFSIPGELLGIGSVISGYKLYSANEERYEYAEVSASDDDAITISDNVTLEVDWTINISYK